jgi:hypothetical protein
VVVAVTVVGVVQMIADEIVDVIAVRDSFVATAGSMHVTGRMSGARMP